MQGDAKVFDSIVLHLCTAEKTSDKKYTNNKHQHFSVGKI